MSSKFADSLRRMWLPVLVVAGFGMAIPTAVGAEKGSEDEGQFLSNARQLTFEGKRAGEGYFHPDGNLLAFQSEREEGNPFYQIYLLDLLSGESARLSPGTGKTTCAFFQADTGRVLYASTHADPKAEQKQKEELEFRASGKQRRYAWDYDETFEIYSANQDGTQLQQLTKALGYDAEAAYSPDGKQIVFCSMRSAYPEDGQLSPQDKARREKDPAYYGDIYIMNADGSNVRRLTEAPGYDGGPFFSPDGQRIVWRHFDESGMFADVWTMKTDGSDKRRVTDFGCMSWAPYYHPSGKYLIFTANKLGFENFELFVVDVNGEKEPVRVSFTEGFDGLPVFAPDGKRLCWTSNRTSDKKSQLFMADWSHDAALKAIEAAPKRQERKALKESEGAKQTEIYTTERQKAAPLVSQLDGDAVMQLRDVAVPLTPEIRAEELRAQVQWLADPAREGRRTGSPGAEATAELAAEYFKNLGLKPVGDSFFHTFEFNAGERILPEKNHLNITSTEGESATIKLTLEKDYRPLALSETGKAEGEVVFAGYGLSVPESNGNARYNSFDGLDVKDKIVLILRYVPEAVDAQRRAHLNRYAGLRYKAMMARERGAKAVLFVTGPNSPHAGELLPLGGDSTLASSGIIVHSITDEVANMLLKPSGKNLKDLQTALDNENPHVEGGFVVPKVRVDLAAGVEHIKKTDRNVVAYLPPADNSAPPAPVPVAHDPHTPNAAHHRTADLHQVKLNPHAAPVASGQAGGPTSQKSEWVFLGAHYDHLGTANGTTSLARSGEEEKIHPGADDNASGVALIMEVAASLAKERRENPEKFRRGVVFALWSGEEIGIIGSSAFAERPPLDLAQTVAYLNFDMVGRLRDNKLTLQGVGSSKLWRKLIEKRNVAAGFALTLQDDPYLPTDTTALYPKRIPVLNFFTGSHDDYHRPTDTADKLNYEGLERVSKFARTLIFDVANGTDRPDFARIERSQQNQGSRETLRAYLGTIPDYANDVKGVKFSGVRAGSPAEKAGIQGGDVLVEFGGQKIQNIYDYTYALDAVKIGEPAKAVVERNGQRVELTVTPEARK